MSEVAVGNTVHLNLVGGRPPVVFDESGKAMY